MSETKVCSYCKGRGNVEVLVTQHDDKTEVVKCIHCNGKGVIHQMSEEDERDYYADYW
jgi:DnaJ-class molecular chaperone